MRLDHFAPEDAPTVAGWPVSAAEARSWAGDATRWPVAPADLLAWHEDPDVLAFVLRDGQEVVAYGEVWLDEDEREVELSRILVRPERRGQGIGRRLVLLLLSRVPRLFPVAFVRVVPGNVAALACYEGAGFARVSEPERNAFNQGQPVDYVWLRYDLGAPAGTG